MARRECAGQSFAEVARLVSCGLSAEQACEPTGPDLQASLRMLSND